jgi:hypothetical protein
MVCLIMRKYNDAPILQWENKNKHWNIGPTIHLRVFPGEANYGANPFPKDKGFAIIY